MATTDERLETAATALEAARRGLDVCEAGDIQARLGLILTAYMQVHHASWHLGEVRTDTALVRSMRALCDTMLTSCGEQWAAALERLDA